VGIPVSLGRGGCQNRSEKLHEKAVALFDKDKSYSPLAIKGIANGETTPAKEC